MADLVIVRADPEKIRAVLEEHRGKRLVAVFETAEYDSAEWESYMQSRAENAGTMYVTLPPQPKACREFYFDEREVTDG